ncbi:MAG: PSD1 and planctomycete cytochrome C domain-containing protein [Planctomycetota bacterium]|jgi:mono/diheme cytochrome c family protein
MRRFVWCLIFGLTISGLKATCCIAAESDSDKVDFARQVLPILSDKCFACHGPDTKDEDELRLDSFEAATADRDGYRAIDPAKPEASELLRRINSTDEPMPPADAEKQLTDAEREILNRWVKQGGEYGQHWSFVVPRKAQPPGDADATGGAAIDAFIARRLKRRGVDFAAQADKATLARRAALVLTGLPPELDQLQAFLDDDRPDAYERFVDELLQSPRFGEHQARYWLDAVRYGDTHGLHLDNRRGIYPYRDWVVRSFNRNLPLNQFIEWQIAGDLMNSPTPEQLVATGYVRLNPSTGEGGAIPAEFQMKNNFDRVETLGTVFLGISMVCARCHNHKYDPFTQTDYYGLLAFFNSTAEPALDGNKYEYGPTVKVPKDQAGWDRWQQLQAKRQELIRLAYDHIENGAGLPREPLSKWLDSTAEERLKMLADPKSATAAFKLTEQAADVQKQLTDLEGSFTTSLIAKDIAKPRETRVLRRGEYDLPVGDAITPNVPAMLNTLPEDAPRNRIALAKWLTSPDNPLVSRVLVNRIWQSVFGAGLVRTPEDFGLQGQQPTHPELLDWLAVELQESGWDFKHILRLLVTSRTFKQDSRFRTDVDDPENHVLARGPSYRLDAEVIRDIGLWSSELLDPHMGGEGVKPYQPAGMWLALAHPASNTKKYERDSGQLLYRRSLYVYWKRTSPHPMMILFDAPDRESSCVRRSRTTTAQQSLGLFNETQRIEMARKLAERLIRKADNDDARIDLLFRLLASRSPTDAEREVCRTLIEAMQQRYADSETDAVELLKIGEAPRDGSLPAKDVAAWTQITVTILASDSAILLY